MAIRAVSLDLWFTAYLRTSDLAAKWERARRSALLDLLSAPGKAGPASREVLEADRRVRDWLQRSGLDPDLLSPRTFLGLVEQEAGARLNATLDRPEERYALAGFTEDPPIMNPDLPDLKARLTERGLKMVYITNSHRPGELLQRFFRERGEPAADAIFTSCESGARKPAPEIFRRAAAELGLSPQEILHVGDRIDSDVAGAWAVGMPTALFTGYQRFYPPDSEELRVRDLDLGSLTAGVARIARLPEIVALLESPDPARPGKLGRPRPA